MPWVCVTKKLRRTWEVRFWKNAKPETVPVAHRPEDIQYFRFYKFFKNGSLKQIQNRIVPKKIKMTPQKKMTEIQLLYQLNESAQQNQYELELNFSQREFSY